MIIEEVLNVMKDRPISLQAKMLSELTDQFRSGRNPSDILKLINLEDEYLIEFGIYLIGEVIIDNQSIIPPIIDRLYVLLEHKNSRIRLKTFINLSQLLEERDLKEPKELYLKMCKDDDEFIRLTAKRLLDTGNLKGGV
ncbi:MAG: hypothetical protein MUE85_07350 [Microscillaceae bacterium]|nr:hypothetical protein [Microscillaceae bacterium]